jgi:hypothetical protein
VKLEAVFGGKFGDEFFVSVRGSPAQLVIEVDNAENDAEPLAQFHQQQQQRHGIGSARDGYTNTVTWAEKPLSFNVLKQLLAQRRAHG